MSEPKPTEAERLKAIEIAARKYHDAHVIDESEHASGCSVVQKKSDECDCGFDDLDVALSALVAARSPAPEWRPTHRHYKGGLYRKLGEGIHTETSEPLTFYDNAKGELFARPTAMFLGRLSLGDDLLRFTPLPSPPKET